MRILVDEAYYGSQTLQLFRLTLDTFEIRVLTKDVVPHVSRRLSQMTLDEGVGAVVGGGQLIVAQRWFEELLTVWVEAPWALAQASAIEPKMLHLATSYTSLAFGELTPDLLQTRFFAHRFEPIIGWASSRSLAYLINRSPRTFSKFRSANTIPHRRFGKMTHYSIAHTLSVYHMWSLLGGSPFRSRLVTSIHFGPPLDLHLAYQRCLAVSVLDPAVAADPDLGVRILQARLLSVLRHTLGYRECSGAWETDFPALAED